MLHYFLYPFLFFTHLFCPSFSGKEQLANDPKQTEHYDPATVEENTGLLQAGITCANGKTFDDNNNKEIEPRGGKCCVYGLAAGFLGTLGTLTVWAFIQGMSQHG